MKKNLNPNWIFITNLKRTRLTSKLVQKAYKRQRRRHVCENKEIFRFFIAGKSFVIIEFKIKKVQQNLMSLMWIRCFPSQRSKLKSIAWEKVSTVPPIIHICCAMRMSILIQQYQMALELYLVHLKRLATRIVTPIVLVNLTSSTDPHEFDGIYLEKQNNFRYECRLWWKSFLMPNYRQLYAVYQAAWWQLPNHINRNHNLSGRILLRSWLWYIWMWLTRHTKYFNMG